MKLKDIIAGTRAIHRVRMPLVNVPAPYAPEQPELAAQRERDHAAAAPAEGAAVSAFPTHIEVGLRVLTAGEIDQILEYAAVQTTKKGGKAHPSDPQYQFQLALYTSAIAAVDPESDPKKPEPFFGAGTIDSAVAEILSSPHVGRDGLIFLQEHQEHWQDVCNPQALKLTPEQLWAKVGELASSPDADSFLELRPGMRWSLARFMASQLMSLPEHRLLSGPDLPEESSNSSPAAPGEA